MTVMVGLAGWLVWYIWVRPSTAAERRGHLLAANGPRIEKVWLPGDSPLRGQPKGDVVWSDQLQIGSVRLAGVPANDPSKQRYQIWIVDRRRQGPPVTGGLFDVLSAKPMVVPIRAALPIGESRAFFVTLENSLGAVVSDRRHVIVRTAP